MPNEGLLMLSPLSSVCHLLFLDTFGPTASDQQARRNVILPRMRLATRRGRPQKKKYLDS